MKKKKRPIKSVNQVNLLGKNTQTILPFQENLKKIYSAIVLLFFFISAIIVLNGMNSSFIYKEKIEYLYGYVAFASSLFISMFIFLWKAYSLGTKLFSTLKKYWIWLTIYILIAFIFMILLVILKNIFTPSEEAYYQPNDFALYSFLVFVSIILIEIIFYALTAINSRRTSFLLMKYSVIKLKTNFAWLIILLSTYFIALDIAKNFNNGNIYLAFIISVFVYPEANTVFGLIGLIVLFGGLLAFIGYQKNKIKFKKRLENKSISFAINCLLGLMSGVLIWHLQSSSGIDVTFFNEAGVIIFLIIVIIVLALAIGLSYAYRNLSSKNTIISSILTWANLIIWLLFIIIRFVADYKAEIRSGLYSYSSLNLYIATFGIFISLVLWAVFKVTANGLTYWGFLLAIIVLIFTMIMFTFLRLNNQQLLTESSVRIDLLMYGLVFIFLLLSTARSTFALMVRARLINKNYVLDVIKKQKVDYSFMNTKEIVIKKGE